MKSRGNVKKLYCHKIAERILQQIGEEQESGTLINFLQKLRTIRFDRMHCKEMYRDVFVFLVLLGSVET